MSIGIKRWVWTNPAHTRVELYTQGNRRSIGAIVLCKRHGGQPVNTKRHCFILF